MRALRPAGLRGRPRVASGGITVAVASLVLAACSGSGHSAGHPASRISATLTAAAAAVCDQPQQSSTPAAPHSPGAAGPAAVIRVDQVGYPATAPKLGEIMTSAAMPGGVGWVLVRAGQAGGKCAVVASGTARQDLGSWSKRYGWVWAVSFSGVRQSGSYRLGLASDPSVTSPWFPVGPAAQVYARPLANALSFYQNERDGPDFIRSPLRSAPGDLSDENAMTYRTPPVNGDGDFKGSLAKYATRVRINASGGWFDAGDYLHFVDTTSYTEAVLLQGIASFPGQMGSSGQVSFTSEAKFGLDFLLRMWNERTRTLYYQVGTGEANDRYFGDHDIWRLPQADDHYMGANPRYQYIRHPPVFRAGKPGSPISPNLAGRLAADFALCYRVFRTADPGYASRCLQSAETVYGLAGTHWKGRLLTVIPFDFYGETTWRDDMMLGATELALSLRSAGSQTALPRSLPVRSATTYLRDAATWAGQWVTGGSATSDTLNLYNVSALADYELYLALGADPPSGLAVTRRQLLGNLLAQISKARAIGAKDPFGFGFAWDQWDTTTHGAGLSVMANEYDALTGRPVFAALAERWLDDILGANAWGVSLIVGDGAVFPDCMQHQIANLVGSADGKPPVLAGAAVEGPNSFAATGTVPSMRRCVANGPGNVPYKAFSGHHALFADNVQSYSTVEPAIDLTALTPLAFAWQEAGTASAPRP
ncbi:MAG TPA: glycoside hydrolase family 9 protein [Streptosporangiaceae bacterium]